MRRVLSTIAVAAVLAVAAPMAEAQEGPAVPEPLEVGAMAPDFSIPGATRHGVLAEPVTLKEYEGKTVVLAFFFRARTRG
jgi:hypothetical protein